MKELISIAVLIASMYGGSLLGDKILKTARREALTKTAQGLPQLSTLSHALTQQKSKTK